VVGDFDAFTSTRGSTWAGSRECLLANKMCLRHLTVLHHVTRETRKSVLVLWVKYRSINVARDVALFVSLLIDKSSIEVLRKEGSEA
jgi:hypothetical protein